MPSPGINIRDPQRCSVGLVYETTATAVLCASTIFRRGRLISNRRCKANHCCQAYPWTSAVPLALAKLYTSWAASPRVEQLQTWPPRSPDPRTRSTNTVGRNRPTSRGRRRASNRRAKEVQQAGVATPCSEPGSKGRD
jgi:hypothetical protein